SLGRHDQRRQMVVDESNAIADFDTCASLLGEPQRSNLRAVIREYARNEETALSRFLPKEEQRKVTEQSRVLHGRMTDIVAQAVALGTPIAVCLTNTLNAVTSANASRLAAFEEKLPWTILLLLLLASVVPSFLTGKQQGASQKTRLSGTASFVLLVTLVIFIVLDLNQGRRGLIKVNREPFDRLLQTLER